MIERFRPPPPGKIPRVRGPQLKTFYQMTLGQQNAALRLCAAHARNVEFIPPEDYARCILHWQVSEQGDVVGWISSHPHTKKDAPNG